MHTAGKVLLIIGGVLTVIGIGITVMGAASANLDPSQKMLWEMSSILQSLMMTSMVSTQKQA
jgi:hypothetical protein